MKVVQKDQEGRRLHLSSAVKAKHTIDLDYMCTTQIAEQIQKMIHISWSIGLGENSRACSHFKTDTEAPPRTINDRRPPANWRLAKEPWNNRQDSSHITIQDLPKHFSLTDSLTHQLLHLFHKTLYIELCSLI